MISAASRFFEKSLHSACERALSSTRLSPSATMSGRTSTRVHRFRLCRTGIGISCAMSRLVGEGRIKYREDVVEGLENAPTRPYRPPARTRGTLLRGGLAACGIGHGTRLRLSKPRSRRFARRRISLPAMRPVAQPPLAASSPYCAVSPAAPGSDAGPRCENPPRHAAPPPLGTRSANCEPSQDSSVPSSISR
jgi:hypothetical protein